MPNAAENAKSQPTICKLSNKDIKTQGQFDDIYKTASPSVRDKLLDNKYAISSRAVQDNPRYYFSMFENKLEKALDNYKRGVLDCIILRYYKKLVGMKNYRDLLYRVMNKETLDTYPDLKEVCKKFVMSKLGEGNSAKAIYKYSEMMDIPTIELYKMTIKHLCSATIVCDLDKDDAYLYYKVLQEHLTLEDYKSVIRSNRKVLATVTAAEQCWIVAVMAVVAFQKNLIEEIPAQLRGPYVFAVDTKHATMEQI